MSVYPAREHGKKLFMKDFCWPSFAFFEHSLAISPSVVFQLHQTCKADVFVPA